MPDRPTADAAARRNRIQDHIGGLVGYLRQRRFDRLKAEHRRPACRAGNAGPAASSRRVP
jgi:hypothetical protein